MHKQEIFTLRLNRHCDSALKELLPALIQYRLIQNTFHKVDVSRDLDFQRKFNAYYRVRRGLEWRKCFYSLMERAKAERLSFENVLKIIEQETGSCEASFASKLIATKDPTKPIIDKFVLINFGLRLPAPTNQNRTKKIVEVYDELANSYRTLLKSDLGKNLCRKFNDKYREYRDISDLKKIDLVLWKIR